jgi:hypothetical protein
VTLSYVFKDFEQELKKQSSVNTSLPIGLAAVGVSTRIIAVLGEKVGIEKNYRAKRVGKLTISLFMCRTNNSNCN